MNKLILPKIQFCLWHTHWRGDLHAKKGIYYSESGLYKRFSRDALSSVNLENNPTGYTSVYLLVHTIRPENGEVEILFGLKSYRGERDEANPHPLLGLPAAKPRKRNEAGRSIARRAFERISNQADIGNQGLKTRFLFQHRSVIYPLYLTTEHARTVTESFTPNEQLLSIRWVPLASVLERLPPWDDYLISEATSTELAQHRYIHPVGIQIGPNKLWQGTATCLMCIREYVPGGFHQFLKVWAAQFHENPPVPNRLTSYELNETFILSRAFKAEHFDEHIYSTWEWEWVFHLDSVNTNTLTVTLGMHQFQLNGYQ